MYGARFSISIVVTVPLSSVRVDYSLPSRGFLPRRATHRHPQARRGRASLPRGRALPPHPRPRPPRLTGVSSALSAVAHPPAPTPTVSVPPPPPAASPPPAFSNSPPRLARAIVPPLDRLVRLLTEGGPATSWPGRAATRSRPSAPAHRNPPSQTRAWGYCSHPTSHTLQLTTTHNPSPASSPPTTSHSPRAGKHPRTRRQRPLRQSLAPHPTAMVIRRQCVPPLWRTLPRSPHRQSRAARRRRRRRHYFSRRGIQRLDHPPILRWFVPIPEHQVPVLAIHRDSPPTRASGSAAVPW